MALTDMAVDISRDHRKCNMRRHHHHNNRTTTSSKRRLLGVRAEAAIRDVSKPVSQRSAVVSCVRKDASAALIAASVPRTAAK